MADRIYSRRKPPLYLAEWRLEKGLTQDQLGSRLGPKGVSGVTVSRWETGKRRPNLDVQEAIAEALGIDAVDLRRHPAQPSADALLRGQPPEVIDQAMKLIHAIRR